MKSTLSSYRTRADKLQTQYDWARQAIRSERRQLSQAKEHLTHVSEAQRLLQTVAQSVQQEAHLRIATVVTSCLRSVFQDDAYEFKIVFDRKRGRTEAKMFFTRDGMEIDPLSAAGGGVVDVAAFALRVACLMLSRPPVRKVLILDEPFSHVKPPEIMGPRICEMIERLSEEMGIQFVIVPSIEQHFQVGKVVQF